MELTHDILRFTHILFGSFSLILFWIPAFARKGSKLHVKAGQAHVATMAVVVVSAAILSAMIIGFTDRLGLGLFLGFLAVITANPLFIGWSAFKPRPWHKNFQIFIEAVIGLFALVMIYFGTKAPSGGNILFFFFGGLGVLTVFGTFRRLMAGKGIN